MHYCMISYDIICHNMLLYDIIYRLKYQNKEQEIDVLHPYNNQNVCITA